MKNIISTIMLVFFVTTLYSAEPNKNGYKEFNWGDTTLELMDKTDHNIYQSGSKTVKIKGYNNTVQCYEFRDGVTSYLVLDAKLVYIKKGYFDADQIKQALIDTYGPYKIDNEEKYHNDYWPSTVNWKKKHTDYTWIYGNTVIVLTIDADSRMMPTVEYIKKDLQKDIFEFAKKYQDLEKFEY